MNTNSLFYIKNKEKPLRLSGEKQIKTTEGTELFHKVHRDFPPLPLRLLCVLCG
jgi:hypothetical protein